jgi:sarcosine oxidase, subunit gamma
MLELLPESPLAPEMREFAGADLEIRQLTPLAQLRIQALRARSATTRPVADARKLPAAPNSALGNEPFALWRAPDDWLVYSHRHSIDDLYEWVAAIESGVPLVVTDISSASVVLELSGPRCVEVLMRDCTLDLEGGAIPPGSCARTGFAQTTILIHRPAQNGPWRLFVDRSLAAHVWEWLLDTAGVPLPSTPDEPS